MINKFTKNCLWFAYQSLRYRNSSISFPFGSRLQKSNLAKNIKIGKSFVYNSEIGSNVSISDFCSICNSEIGSNVSISDSCSICNSILEAQVSVYSETNILDSYVGRFTYIAKQSNFNLVKIGRFCSIGSQILCGSGEHPTDFVSTHPIFFSNLKQCGISFTNNNLFEERKEVIIGNDVWIGSRVFIKDGISIGNGAIVGAGSVVVKDVPDYAIVGGVPAKVIRFRFSEDVIQKLQLIKWWNLSEEKLREAQPLIAHKDIQAFIMWYENNIFLP